MAIDFGQYEERVVLSRIRPKKGSGICCRCGNRTKAKTCFGATICNKCWEQQVKIIPKR